MKILRNLLAILSLITILSIMAVEPAQAQCSMCTANAENSVSNGNTEGKGLNDGILYLLAAPYLAIACIGFIWYKKYRRKDIAMDIRDEKINLN